MSCGDDVLAIDLTAPMRLCRRVLPRMSGRGGSIVNVSSAAGLGGSDTIERAGLDAVDGLDSRSAVLLAEQLDLPLLTASDDVTSVRVEIHRPW